MAFTSISFALFLLIVFLLYWFVFNKTYKSQNTLLLLASVVFYCISNWIFISLLATSGFVNFWLAKSVSQKEDESNSKKFLFYFGIIFNIGILLYFKYFNFFIQNFVTLFNYNNPNKISFTPFHILLPLGISFFTFQMIGYLIDVNNEEIEPTNDLLSFFTYLAYFPKILSGPIEKLQDFLPQIQKKREFNYALAVDGLRQILWGLFKKIVIANNATTIADTIFNDYQNMSGSILLMGAIFYSFGLYADFSGYSDIACGVSKLFNIKITNNFKYPFFATNISEFWRRWHISLTVWMMNYVYTPLSFITRKHNQFGLVISITFTFLLVGFWHGANWTYIIFGLYHGILFIPLTLKGSNVKNNKPETNKLGLPTLNNIIHIIITFILTTFGMIIFRSDNLDQALSYISKILSPSLFTLSYFPGGRIALTTIILIFIFILFEWYGRKEEHAIRHYCIKWRQPFRYILYCAIIFNIILFGSQNEQFIYFQF